MDRYTKRDRTGKGNSFRREYTMGKCRCGSTLGTVEGGKLRCAKCGAVVGYMAETERHGRDLAFACKVLAGQRDWRDAVKWAVGVLRECADFYDPDKAALPEKERLALEFERTF